MSERLPQREPHQSRFRRVSGFIGRHEIAIGTGLTISSVVYLDALNKVLGIGDNLNPATITEIGLVGLGAAFLGASLRMRERPSRMLRDIITVLASGIRKSSSHPQS